MKFIVWLVLSLFAAGCAADTRDSKYPHPLAPDLVMHGDKSFTASERTQIETAAGVWREQTSGQANISIVWDWDKETTIPKDEHKIEKLTSLDLEVIMTDCYLSEEMGLKPCTPTVLAWVEQSGGIHNPEHEAVMLKFIPDRYGSAESFISVAIHEFGHVFGLPHQNVPQAVMYPSQNAVKTCLKPSDLAAFCQVNVCDKRPVYPCE